MEETLCFENENPEVITSLEEKREYATLSTSQLNILALEMPLYVECISSDFRDKPYLNFFCFPTLYPYKFLTSKQESSP